MAFVWIHRHSAADILIPFEGPIGAHQFAVSVLMTYNAKIMNYNLTNDNYKSGHLEVGEVHDFQISVCRDGFVPFGGWEFWNHEGVFMTNQHDAIALGSHGVPEGFIPGEFLRIWKKETRSKEELDAEIDYYMSGETQIMEELCALPYSALNQSEWDEMTCELDEIRDPSTRLKFLQSFQNKILVRNQHPQSTLV